MGEGCEILADTCGRLRGLIESDEKMKEFDLVLRIPDEDVSIDREG